MNAPGRSAFALACGVSAALACGSGPEAPRPPERPPEKPAARPIAPATPPAPAEMPPEPSTPSHCTTDETTVATCAIQDSHKVLSLCASHDVSATSGYLQYRFGKPGAIELTYPTDRSTQPGRAFVFSGSSIGRDYAVSYDFSVDATRYEVRFQRSELEDQGSVRVMPPARPAVVLSCDQTETAPFIGLPNQEMIAIRAAASAVLDALARDPACGGDQRQAWKEDAEAYVQAKDTDVVSRSDVDDDPEARLAAMTCKK